MDNIIENNKLIAEFMGVFDKILSTGNIHSWSDAPFYYTTEDTKGKVIKNICKYSKYDSDWNWLMEVVEKIESLGYRTLTENECFMITKNKLEPFDVRSKDDYSTIFSDNYEINHYESTKLTNTYTAIVEFIKWYNEQNKNNEKHTCIIDK